MIGIGILCPSVPSVPSSFSIVHIAVCKPDRESLRQCSHQLPLTDSLPQHLWYLPVHPFPCHACTADAIDLYWGVDAHQTPERRRRIQQLGVRQEAAQPEEVVDADAEGHAVAQLKAQPASIYPQLSKDLRYLFHRPQFPPRPLSTLGDPADLGDPRAASCGAEMFSPCGRRHKQAIAVGREDIPCGPRLTEIMPLMGLR